MRLVLKVNFFVSSFSRPCLWQAVKAASDFTCPCCRLVITAVTSDLSRGKDRSEEEVIQTRIPRRPRQGINQFKSKVKHLSYYSGVFPFNFEADRVTPVEIRAPAPVIRAPAPEIRAADPQRRAASPEMRAASPEMRAASPEMRAAGPEIRASVRAPVRVESRAAAGARAAAAAEARAAEGRAVAEARAAEAAEARAATRSEAVVYQHPNQVLRRSERTRRRSSLLTGFGKLSR